MVIFDLLFVWRLFSYACNKTTKNWVDFLQCFNFLQIESILSSFLIKKYVLHPLKFVILMTLDLICNLLSKMVIYILLRHEVVWKLFLLFLLSWFIVDKGWETLINALHLYTVTVSILTAKFKAYLTQFKHFDQDLIYGKKLLLKAKYISLNAGYEWKQLRKIHSMCSEKIYIYYCCFTNWTSCSLIS